MKSFILIAAVVLAQTAGPVAGAGDFRGREPGGLEGEWVADAAAAETWDQAISGLDPSKAIIPIDNASVIIEVNATDQDAGFQVFLDSEGWRDVQVFGPNGRAILRALVWGGIREIGGGTELFLESQEPEYESLDELEELIRLLPEGEYRFIATLVGGDYAIGRAVLSHMLPGAPKLVSPVPSPTQECSRVSRSAAVIGWEPVTEPLPMRVQAQTRDVNIAAYQVIVEDERAGLTLSMTVDAYTNEIMLPADFLRRGTEYRFEVLAIEAGGNQTISEACFVIAEE